MNLFEDLRRFFCCCLPSNQITSHRTFNDPSEFYISSGINALNLSDKKRLIIADFGSSSGQNSIKMMKIILQYLNQLKKVRMSLLIIHIDLPSNNWTQFFQILAHDHSYHSFAIGRSFYEQCLPTNSLSVGFSTASLHYLSKKPCNILEHCYVHFAEENERQLFRKQSKVDFNTFIEHRSRELQSGGILILSIPSIDENEEMAFNRYFDLIYQCAQIFSTEEWVDFTLPFYLRPLSECVDTELFNRCALKLIKVEFVRLKPPIFRHYRNGQITLDQFVKSLLVVMQSSTESTLRQTLDIHRRSKIEKERISTQFWALFEERLKNQVSHDDDASIHTTFLILKKK